MKIEKIKKVGSKYKIILDSDEVITTYEEVILKNGLLYNRNINEKEREKILNDTAYYISYHKALNMISRRLRSEYEIRKELRKNDLSNKEIDRIINDLKKIKLINDKEYAKAYTNDKINLSHDGPYKIRKNLEEHKIDEKYIEEAISNINNEILYEHIDKIINKKIKNNTKYPAYMLKQKMVNYLVNLGYDKTMIFNRLENIKIENKNLEKEMEKVLNQLKTKYKEEELIYKLKSKLYTKGFSKEEIENFINKNSSLI
ncbi:MAG: RecX family transcriptional regulator [Bacilli bacterium]|nr:RecX family transcriptional regulator [Bacilli bacterium]